MLLKRVFVASARVKTKRQDIIMKSNPLYRVMFIIVPIIAMQNEIDVASGNHQEEFLNEGLFAAFVTDEVTPFPAKLLCEYSPGLNKAQKNVCMEYPAAMPVLQEVIDLVHDECAMQLKEERWNCTNVVPPIFGEQAAELKGATKEAGFTHALTSAAMVYAITKACSEGRIKDCGCVTSLNGKKTPQGWEWGGCSDDVEFGAKFASNFLDVRETENIMGLPENELGLSLVNLHNNAAGRMIVQKGMKLECYCHGVSGSCAAKTCWRKVPTMEDIGQSIKDKYDDSIKVSVQTAKTNEPPSLRSVGDKVPVSTSHLVHLQKSQDYCSIVTNYTQGRECVPKIIKNSYDVNGGDNTTLVISVDRTLPACEELCCTGEYSVKRTVTEQTCKCRFEWCCNIICDDCITILDTYTCDR